MRKAVISVVIMLVSACAGIFVGAAMNAAETFGLIFAVIAGFACTIYAIESKKGD